MNINPQLHPLHTDAEPPSRFNNPFYYTPDALCRAAMAEVAAYLEGDASQRFLPSPVSPEFQSEISRGKMLGVLVVRPSRLPRLFYLAAYSGQVAGRSDWPGFVPAVFDYLQPDGYFKREEAEIVKINREIATLPRPLRWEGSAELSVRPVACKGRREGETEPDYIRRRQHENAELHRWKLQERAARDTFEAAQQERRDRITALKTLRRKKSDALQTWLFRQFVMRNARGESKDLVEISSLDSLSPNPSPTGEGNVPQGVLRFPSPMGEGLGERLPSGSGECCEPKLLQYAFAHGLRPVSMAMFWWGESPKEEVRHHLQCYPACNGKCKPILRWMLQGMEVEPNALEQESRHELEWVYDDDDICVVCKPAGMLSAPGKSGRESVMSVVRARCPEAEGPLIVHRLDMATSGLMVVAKSLEMYKVLQGQFLRREVSKRYVAVLSRDVAEAEGDIGLPLRPDLDDRPRQVVDEVWGKPAQTHYERLSARRVALYPHTGRTHQLRVHCAHGRGLDNPIVGDELYGQKADRLYLHAEWLAFCHPRTGRRMEFEAKAPF